MGVLGPRQCGKTTLALEYSKKFSSYYHFDLEDPLHLSQLETPHLTLEGLEGLIIIDEVQRRPELFPYLRVLVDRKPHLKLLILGSASHDLLQQSSETLAGRIGYIELTPFNLKEAKDLSTLWQRGGFPKSFLASTFAQSVLWRKAYISTFLEKDIASLGFHRPPQEMRRVWTMAAHYHGNLVNYSELGRSLSVSDMTVRKYLHILESAFMIRLLKAWFENIKKRQVKSPKLYFRDSGLLHSLLGVEGEAMKFHPKVGASWEGFALEEVIRIQEVAQEDCYFWGTQNKAELDLLILKEGKKIGFEFKYTDSPRITPSMRIALEELSLSKLNVIIPGNKNFPLAERIHVVGLETFTHLPL